MPKHSSNFNTLCLSVALSLFAHILVGGLLDKGGPQSQSTITPDLTLHGYLNTQQQPKTETTVLPALQPLSTTSEERAVEEPAQKNTTSTQAPPPSLPDGILQVGHYFSAKELDQRPRPLQQITPRYPDDADTLEIVVLSLFISDRGEVDTIEVLTAGLDERFTRSAINAFRVARFSPGQRKGQSVPSKMLIEVVFDPADIQANWEKGH